MLFRPDLVTPDGKTIAGFYTLSAYSVGLDKIPDEIAKKLTRMPEVPATLIGRLARSDAFPGQRIGESLLADAVERSLANSKGVASWAVIVDAKDANAVAFYKKYGFIEISQHAKSPLFSDGDNRQALLTILSIYLKQCVFIGYF